MIDFASEIWKDINGYEGLYQVSNLGRVKSLDKYILRKGTSVSFLVKGIIMKQKISNRLYLRVGLVKNGYQKQCSVHRLVAEAFINNPENKPEVNHKDGIKKHNYDWNLEWSTKSENMIHAFKMGLQKNAIGENDSQSKKIYQYDLEGNFIQSFGSIREAGRAGFARACISDCLEGKYSQHRQFMWSRELLTKEALLKTA